jgi:four helix bundle protein
VPLNIAEGNGKFAVRDRCRFIEIARGSAFECAACLDVLVAKGLCNRDKISAGKAQLFEIVSMLTGLQNSLLSRIGEESPEYLAPRE